MRIDNILIATASAQGVDIALERARVIEHITEADVYLLQVIWDFIEEEPDSVISKEAQQRIIERLMKSEQRVLEDAAAPYVDKIETLTTEVAWAKHMEERVANEVVSRQVDLVIKPVIEASRRVHDWFVTPVDWRLMRALDAPILFAQAPTWRKDRCVLAALDIAPAHAGVSNRIIDCAKSLAEVLACPVHFVHVTPNADSKTHAVLERMVEGDAELHVKEGKPAEVIDKLADDLDASLTIVGTAARRTIGKLLVGNTAEEIIGRTTRDLVTVHAPS